MKLYLTFPGGARTDYSTSLIDQSVSISQRLMNDECRSTVDTCRFRLKYSSALQAALFTASTWITCELETDAAADIFTGVIAPNFGVRKRTNVEPISIEAVDNSYLLDEPIKVSFNYPAAIGGTPYAIFDADDSTANIVWELLEDAGYTPATDIAASTSDIATTIEYVQGTEFQETYREYLDDLLSEYGWVFHFDASGKFNVYQWDKDTVTSTATIDEDMEIRKSDIQYDGFEVEFAQTETLDETLLYRDNLPVSLEDDPNRPWVGQAIGAGDYYPPDGDIDDIWQNYNIKYLDKPWVNRETRLKNKDISLIAAEASDSTVYFEADAGVDVYSSSYESHRAKVLFKNTSAAAAKIYYFDIYGKALYRKYRRYTLCPDTSVKPKDYVSRFLYDDTLATVQANATRFARAMARMLVNGAYKYYWTDRTDKAVGTIVRVLMTNPSVDQTAVIVERIWNPQRTTFDYVARGITAYSATTVHSEGDAPDTTPTDGQTIKNAGITGIFTEGGSPIGMQTEATPATNSRRIYMGHMAGDNGPGFYIKEWNGASWENRAFLRMRDPSTWLVVDDMALAMSAANVGLS